MLLQGSVNDRRGTSMLIYRSRIPSSEMRNPANSTSLLANLNLAGLNTKPLLFQCEIILHILCKDPSTEFDQVMISSTIFSKSFLAVVEGQSSRIVSVYLL